MKNRILTIIIALFTIVALGLGNVSTVLAADPAVTVPTGGTFQSSFPKCDPDLSKATPLDATTSAAQEIMWYNEQSGWQCDAEVTFTGKLAARSKEVLNWLLQNYRWSNIQANQPTPFDTIWVFVRNVVYAILLLFVLVAAFLMIITRGRSLTVRRFLIRFVFIALMVWFSFSLIKTIYDIGDVVQSFFINVQDSADPTKTRTIQTADLLNISFNYDEFWGYRKPGIRFDESAITSLILVKITAATYYTMFVILIVRKIILWFFILVSPIFPILLFVKPIRNTAMIWIGEFFRWVLYGPLFMIFLRGLVEIWRFGPKAQSGIPLAFNNLATAYAQNQDVNKLPYPTSINILLGGPGKFPLSGVQNINYPDTFILYLVALVMLWMVIIMPWLLLKIFLDMCCNQGVQQSVMSLLNRPNTPWSPFINRPPVGPTPPGIPPSGSTGLAKSLPMTRFHHTPVMEIQQQMMQEQAQAQQQATQNAMTQQTSSVASSIANMASQASSDAYQSFGALIADKPLKIPDLQTGQVTAELLTATDLNIPTMKDIARYEAAMMSKNQNSTSSAEVTRMNEMLQRLAGTSKLTSPAESSHYSSVRERIVQESNKGNAVAKSMASAVAPTGSAPLPDVNEVQEVNLDDYEEVKKTWTDNYRNLEVPQDAGGQPQTRSQWLKQEVSQIPQVIDKLLSGDPQIQQQGMQQVSQILPFLLLGGFSKAEIVSYLKAKLEAAKTVFSEVIQTEKKAAEEDTMISRTNTQHAQKSMHMAAEATESPSASNSPSSSAGDDEDADSPLRNPNLAAMTGTPALQSAATTKPMDPAMVDLLSSTNLTIPSLRDIARFEMALTSQNTASTPEIAKLTEALNNLAAAQNPALKQKLTQETAKGNPVALSIASAVAQPSKVTIPEVNQVQQVNLDDYEEVRNTWMNNYRTAQTPVDSSNKPVSRTDWIKQDVAQIPQIIDMLLSGDPQVQQQGMAKVSKILPFLLLGGFSKAEIISYLKAKLEAAKAVLTELLQKTDHDDTQLPASQQVKQPSTQSAEIPTPSTGDSKDNLS